MKYVKYFLIVTLSYLIGVLSIIWYWFIREHRAKARNIVYNYVLQNNLPLWQLSRFKYESDTNRYVSEDGYINYTNVSYIKYLWWKWIVWIWIDDECENDTFNINIINKQSWYKLSKNIFGKILLDNTLGYKLFGSSFTLGDKRADESPAYSTINEIHHLYTSITNFDHMYGYTSNRKDLFKLTIRNRIFGWTYYDTINDIDIYKLIFNQKRYQ